MEAERNLHTFHELPENAALELAHQPPLWAGFDGRTRYGLWPCGRLIFGEPNARARTAATGARNALDFRNVGIGRRRGEALRGVRHQEGRAGSRIDVLFFTGIALGHRSGICWMRGDCDCGREGDRECESACENQASAGDRIYRHRRILRMLKAICRHSRRSLGMCLRRKRKSWGTSLHPSFFGALLRARADGRMRHRLWTFCLLLLGQADALARIASGAGNAVYLRESAGRRHANLRRIRHQIRCAFTGERVLGFTAGARRDRGRLGGHGDDGDRRRSRNSDCEPAGKEQSLWWKLQDRHRHAFCSFAVHLSPEVVAAEGIC